MPSVAFQKALAKKKDAVKLMQTAQDAEKKSFAAPTLPDAEFLVKVKATCGVLPNKGIPFVEFKWLITEGEYAGKGHSKTYYLEDEDPEREAQNWERLGKDIKTLLGVSEISITDEGELNDLIERIDNETPHVRSRTKSTESKGKTYLNIYFNKREEVAADATTTVVDAAVSDATPVDLSFTVAKGQKVIYKAAQYEVVSTNPREKTCTLTNDTDGKQQGINWSDVEVLG